MMAIGFAGGALAVVGVLFMLWYIPKKRRENREKAQDEAKHRAELDKREADVRAEVAFEAAKRESEEMQARHEAERKEVEAKHAGGEKSADEIAAGLWAQWKRIKEKHDA